MRPRRWGLAAGLWLAAAAPAAADDWTLIDVRARLANDGRVTVVERHDIVFEKTGKKVFRDFGLNADQAVVLSAVTRIGPDNEEHRLKAVEAVNGSDEFVNYPRGYVYYAIPEFGDNVPLSYRFEYELRNAVAPVWAIAAGPGTRVGDKLELIWPWYRALEVWADWRRAWPKLERYRYDHEVMFPNHDAPVHTVRQIDYHLEYGTAWREVEPKQPVGEGLPSVGAYRAAVRFDYLGAAPPPYASTREAATRLGAVVSIPVIGVLGLLLVLVAERARAHAPVDRTFVETRFLNRAPEEIAFWLDGRRPDGSEVLARLIGEGAMSIELTRPTNNAYDDTPRLHLRRLKRDAEVTPFEARFLEGVFEGASELTSDEWQRRHAAAAYTPDNVVDRALHDAQRVQVKVPWSLAGVALTVVMFGGLVLLFRNIGEIFDIVPIVGIGVFFMVCLVLSWPGGWWSRGMPVRGLLVPLVLLWVAALGTMLVPSRPLPAPAWTGLAIAVLGGYFLTLMRSRMPAKSSSPHADLQRMRYFAQRELDRPRPQLDDRWIPRLRALGLGPAIDAWRAKRGGGFAQPPEAGEGPSITSAVFTGMGPQPWQGPDDWADALYVEPRDEADEGDEAEDEDAEDAAAQKSGDPRLPPIQ
jgi:hypothetical protein